MNFEIHPPRRKRPGEALRARKRNKLMIMPSGKQQESGPFARALSAEIRAALARQRLTAKELAQRAELSESYLGKRLRDKAPLTLNDLEAVCKALKEDLLAFITAAIEAAREAR